MPSSPKINVKAPDPFSAAAEVINGTVKQLFQNKIYKLNLFKLNY